MVRTKQGGSILGFVVIGGILALLLVGGAYFVRHQLASTADTDTGSLVTQDSTGDSTDPSDEGVETPENTDEQADEEVVLPGRSDDSWTEVGTEAEDEQSTEDEQDVAVVTDLPQTGPADVLLGGIMVGSIVGVTVAYKRSRDAVASF